MSKQRWLESMSDIDATYISEADPSAATERKRKRRRLFALIAACLGSFIVVCNAILFIPFPSSPPDVSRYAQSPYYSVIQKLNSLSYEPPRYKNNFEMFASNLYTFFHPIKYGGDIGVLPPEMNGAFDGNEPDSPSPYEEITDNQVEGVVEADRIKRTDTHVFYLDQTTVKAFTVAKEESAQVGEYALFASDDDRYYYRLPQEFYLSEDGKTLNVIVQCGERDWSTYVQIISLDVQDPANIVEKSIVSVDGYYLSSRLAHGNVLLFTQYRIENSIDFDREETFIPQIDDGDGKKSLPADEIVAPERLTYAAYTVVLMLNGNTLEAEGAAAYLSYSENVYVSADCIYLSHAYWDVRDGRYFAQSLISSVQYGDGRLKIGGSAAVDGTLLNQYSMDEYQGVLRIFTTTDLDSGSTSASLYCVDTQTWQTVASVENFAPVGESVRSARFDKNNAYVCTSVRNTDPVFFFDLSDLQAITYKDTGTIEGFSTSLVQFGNGYLLGIGQNGNGEFKAEIYCETESGVEAVCSYQKQFSYYYSQDYKSYYIDRENHLLGLGMMLYDTQQSCVYAVLYFDGYQLQELLCTTLNGVPDTHRGVYIDGYMYLFGQNDFFVAPLSLS